MRDLKFRAIYQSPDTDEPNQVFVSEPISLQDMVEYAEFQVDFTDGSYLMNGEMEEKCTKWVQYTGCKDKNGVEIYEGDVLKYTGTGCPCCHRLADVMSNYHAEIRWDSEYAHFEAYSHKYDDTLSSDDWTNNMVIIGNVYENPELINK